jgi:hypothetical protein
MAMTTTTGQEMATLPRELVDQVVFELGRWHDSLIANEVRFVADEVATCGAKVLALLREQYPLQDHAAAAS